MSDYQENKEEEINDLISSVVQKTHSIGPKLAGKLYMQKLKTGMKFVIFFTSGLLSTK